MRSCNTESGELKGEKSFKHKSISAKSMGGKKKKKQLNLTPVLFKAHLQHLASLHSINTIVLYLRFKTKHSPLSYKTQSPTLLWHLHADRGINRQQS